MDTTALDLYPEEEYFGELERCVIEFIKIKAISDGWCPIRIQKYLNGLGWSARWYSIELKEIGQFSMTGNFEIFENLEIFELFGTVYE